MSKHFVIGLVGFGNIGTGVVRHLHQYGEMLSSRAPRRLTLKWIADPDPDRDRGVPVDGVKLTADYQDILADDEVDAVVELVGGTGVAREIVLGALEAGKHVVTANKALIATYGGELFETARRHHVELLFEAAVGAGIPIFHSLQFGLSPNRVDSVMGILNGTCNYILTRMDEQEGLALEDALAEASKLGYAEPDPTLDIEGDDAAHKIAIIGSMIFGRDLRIGDVIKEGITRLGPEDFLYARDRGFTIKLVAMASMSGDGQPELTVAPTLLTSQHPLAHVNGVQNALWVQAEPIGPTMYYGAGAGQGSTGSGVVSDLLMLARTEAQPLADLLPWKMPTGRIEDTLWPSDYPPRYFRIRHPKAQEMASKVGLNSLGGGEGWAALQVPRQTPAQREEMLGILEGLGVNRDMTCEIRFEQQPETMPLSS